MTPGWTAPAVRGRALLRRSVGVAGAASIAGAGSWERARDVLAATAYGRNLPGDADRRTARLAAAAATVWQIRVLAGWLPPGEALLARLAVGPFEIANVDRHLLHLVGVPQAPPVDLGRLGTAWPRVASAANPSEVRAILTRSSWGDPGGDDRSAIAFGIRLAWARRAMSVDPVVRPWAMGATALLVARERYVFGRSLTAVAGRSVDRLLGAHWRTTTGLDHLIGRLPDSARWVFADHRDPAELWRAELALLDRVEQDAARIVSRHRPSRATLVATLALVLVDSWRVASAIEVAGRGRSVGEVLDAVAG